MNRKKLYLVAGSVAAGLMVIGFLGVRFGIPLLAGLDRSSTPPDSQVVAAQPSDSTLPQIVVGADSTLVTHGPFVVGGMRYTVQLQRDTVGGGKTAAATRRAQILDSAGRVVYDENLYLMRDSTASEDWIELRPAVLEDETGAARGFDFSYVTFPSPANSAVKFSIVAPRGDSLVVLTQTLIGYYGTESALPSGATPGSRRLMAGNQKVIESGRGWFDAMIPLQINFDCRPKGGDCVRIDLKDSIAGLGRFAVKIGARQPVDTAVSIEVFNAPRAPTSERILIPPAQQPEILGGAGRVFFERTPGWYLSGEDEWLEIRLNGRRLWIRGEESFRALGLQQAG